MGHVKLHPLTTSAQVQRHDRGWAGACPRTDQSNDSKKARDTKPYRPLPYMLSSDFQRPVPPPSQQALVVSSLDPVGRRYRSIMLTEGGRRREEGGGSEGGERGRGGREGGGGEEGGRREGGRRGRGKKAGDRHKHAPPTNPFAELTHHAHHIPHPPVSSYTPPTTPTTCPAYLPQPYPDWSAVPRPCWSCRRRQ